MIVVLLNFYSKFLLVIWIGFYYYLDTHNLGLTQRVVENLSILSFETFVV